MKDEKEIKNLVKERYTAISNQSKTTNESSCCGAGGCGPASVTDVIFSDDYTSMEGYLPDADLGLGCGLPTEFAKIKQGDTVVDLGSGAGNDCFVARQLTGDSGRVIGIDMTESMIAKARANAEKVGFRNVEFILGDIDDMPLESGMADVVVSNCVLNLVPDKKKAYDEVFRITKPGGRFSISDVVIRGQLPDELKTAAEMYAGCVSGALEKEDYLSIIKAAGFEDVRIEKEKTIHVPDAILLNYISKEKLEGLRHAGTGIFSITVTGRKPIQA